MNILECMNGQTVRVATIGGQNFIGTIESIDPNGSIIVAHDGVRTGIVGTAIESVTVPVKAGESNE